MKALLLVSELEDEPEFSSGELQITVGDQHFCARARQQDRCRAAVADAIAHRPATVRNATRILVFQNGRIIETGTFDELVQRGGHFAELVRVQFALPSALPRTSTLPSLDVP